MRTIEITPVDRVETGGVRFGNDWPGFFLRGDDALFVAALISGIYATHDMEQVPGLQSLKVFADQVFEAVPYKQWIDENGHSIIQATTEDLVDDTKVAVKRDGTVTRKEEGDEREEDESDD